VASRVNRDKAVNRAARTRASVRRTDAAAKVTPLVLRPTVGAAAIAVLAGAG
jgi:hypothetical protein